MRMYISKIIEEAKKKGDWAWEMTGVMQEYKEEISACWMCPWWRDMSIVELVVGGLPWAEIQGKGVYLSAGITVTKYQRPGCLNNRNIFCYASGGWKSKIMFPVNLVSGENTLFGLQTDRHLFTVRYMPLLCMYMVKETSAFSSSRNNKKKSHSIM